MTLHAHQWAMVEVPQGTSPGVMTLVGTNTQNSLIAAYPDRFGAGNTADGSAFQTYNLGYAINGAYGSGAFVPGYGAAGTWIAASLSGDTAPRVWDAVVFDFATSTWDVQVNAHGIKNQYSADHITGTEAWAQPWSSDGKLETTNFAGVPHPTQSYRMFVGVGAEYIMCASAYPGAGGIGTSGWSHKYDPTTRSYSLYSTNAITWPRSDAMKEGVCLYDSTAGRIWLVPHMIYGGTTIPYLNLSTQTWYSVSVPSGPAHEDAANWAHSLIHDDGTRRCILHFQNNEANNNYAFVLDLNDTATGWQSCTLTGSLANFAARSYIQAFGVRWAQYPAADGGDNCHYTTDGYSKAITKIAPPGSGITGTWAISTITPASYARASGTSYTLDFPDARGGGGISEGGSTLPHMTRFFYVPALKCFAWVAGGDQPVALWKP